MTHTLSNDEYNAVRNEFDDTSILTQRDVREMTGLSQPVVSIAMSKMVEEGVICWIRNEGINQVKFYSMLKRGC